MFLGEYKEILGRNCSDISFDNITHFYNSYCLKSLVKFLFRLALAHGVKCLRSGFVLFIYFYLDEESKLRLCESKKGTEKKNHRNIFARLKFRRSLERKQIQ